MNKLKTRTLRQGIAVPVFLLVLVIALWSCATRKQVVREEPKKMETAKVEQQKGKETIKPIIAEEFVFTPEKIKEIDTSQTFYDGGRVIALSNKSKFGVIKEIIDSWDEFYPKVEVLEIVLALTYPSDFVVNVIIDKIGDKKGNLFKEPLNVVNEKFTNTKKPGTTVIEFLWGGGDNDVSIHRDKFISVDNEKNKDVYGLYNITLDCYLKVISEPEILKKYFNKPELAGQEFHERLVFERKKVIDYLIKDSSRNYRRARWGWKVPEDNGEE